MFRPPKEGVSGEEALCRGGEEMCVFEYSKLKVSVDAPAKVEKKSKSLRETRLTTMRIF
jgi:hypothetical protein